MNNVATAPKKKVKRRGASLDRKKARAGWWFVAPFAIGFFVLYLPMIIESLTFSFNYMKSQKGGGYILEFVGWENYKFALFEDAEFAQLLISSIKQLVLDVPAIVIFSLFVAILLNQKMAGRGLFRAIFFIPVIISTGLIEQIDLQNTLASIQQNGGVSGGTEELEQTASATDIISVMDVQRLFANMKIGGELVGYVVGLVNSILNIVNRSGVQMLIFLSGLQSISPAIYESAFIDGASAWESFWKITFPMISPMILVNAIYTVIDAFTRQSNEVMKYIEEARGEPEGQTHATAMSWIYFLVVILMIGLVAGIMSTYVFYQRKE